MFLCAADQSVRYIIPYGGSAFFIIQEVPMYQVLYRKYRPRVFADVYGQDHVTSTLKNEIKEGRISHAYLFTGSRGTGKTTCAKILAKAVNCPNAVDGEPCNACEICKGLDSGTIYDVVEIDAASNNGVDNIRDLREEVNYTPTRGKYRVYIIDEVHMLSTGAFNALLKTLEEPPAHVIFILATTEVHKLPATILSRCQRFDFKRIQPESMAVRLQQVAGLEGMELAPDAATLIARIADGALRDGLSILDQCAGRSKQITAQLVSEVAGLAGREALYRLSDAVLARDSSAAVEELAQLHENSYDMERLCVEMINHFRNFMMVKTVKKSRELIICTDDEYKHIEASAGQFTLAQILRGLDLFQSTLVKIKGGATPRIEMEMAFIRLCEPKLETDSDAINQRLSALERAVQNGVPAAPVKTVQSPVPGGTLCIKGAHGIRCGEKEVKVVALDPQHGPVEHGVDVVRPALERAGVGPAPLERGQQRTGQGGLAAAGTGRCDEKLHHLRSPVMRKMGLLAISRCSRPAGFVRLTAIWVTSAVTPRAVRATTAALSVSSAMAEMQRRACGFLASTASTTASMLPLVPPRKTASGAGRASSAWGAFPSMRVRFQAAKRSRFFRIRAQASGSHSTA